MARSPVDEDALLNPAFIAVVLSAAADSHEKAGAGPLTWPLAFVVPPLVLYSDVREHLPKRANAQLAKWVSGNPLIRMENAHRTASMTPYTQRAVRFGVRHGLLQLADGQIAGQVPEGRAQAAIGSEAADIVRSAAFVGRWLAREDAGHIYGLLGLRP